MIKIYRKMKAINAEQFDGSDEMVEKYNITPPMPLDPDYTINTLKGAMALGIGDWVATGINDEHWPITDDVFKKTYAELPAIPKNVANYLTDCKRAHTTIGTSLSGNIVLFGHARSHDMIHDILRWLCLTDNQNLFARAWLDGYRLEEDK